jgi:hypothetical protein
LLPAEVEFPSYLVLPICDPPPTLGHLVQFPLLRTCALVFDQEKVALGQFLNGAMRLLSRGPKSLGHGQFLPTFNSRNAETSVAMLRVAKTAPRKGVIGVSVGSF